MEKMEKMEKGVLELPKITKEEIDQNYLNVKSSYKNGKESPTELVWKIIIKEIRNQSKSNQNFIFFEYRKILAEINNNREIYQNCNFGVIFSELEKEFGKYCIVGDYEMWFFRYYMEDLNANMLNLKEIILRNDFIRQIMKQFYSEKKEITYDFDDRDLDRPEGNNNLTKYIQLMFGKDSIKINKKTEENVEFYSYHFSTTCEEFQNIHLEGIVRIEQLGFMGK